MSNVAPFPAGGRAPERRVDDAISPGFDRIPPQSVNAEKAVLGSVIVDRDMWDVIAPILTAADFYVPMHETIFTALATLVDRGEPLDKITLAEELKQRGLLDNIGGMSYISLLMDAVPTAASAEYYAKIVREKAQCRELIHAGTMITQLGYEGEDDVAGSVVEAERIVVAVADRGAEIARTETIYELAKRVSKADAERAGADIMDTPWPRLTYHLGGTTPGQLILVPAPPKVGKTGLVTLVADFTETFYGPVVHFSPEMNREELTRRYLSLRSGVSVRRQRLGKLDGVSTARIDRAVAQFEGRRIDVADHTDRTINALRRRLRAAQRSGDPARALIVDGVHWLKPPPMPRGSSKNDAMGAIYMALKELAQEFAVVVWGVMHLNRTAVQSGAPSMAWVYGIRDGGNPDGTADAIVFPYRPHQDDPARGHLAQLVVGLTREGVPGSINMTYLGARNLWLEGDDLPKDARRPWFERDAGAAQLSLATEQGRAAEIGIPGDDDEPDVPDSAYDNDIAPIEF